MASRDGARRRLPGGARAATAVRVIDLDRRGPGRARARAPARALVSAFHERSAGRCERVEVGTQLANAAGDAPSTSGSAYVTARSAYDLHMHVAMRIGGLRHRRARRSSWPRSATTTRATRASRASWSARRPRPAPDAVKLQTFSAGGLRARPRHGALRAALALRARRRASWRSWPAWRTRSGCCSCRTPLDLDSVGPARAARGRLQDRVGRQRLPAAARARGSRPDKPVIVSTGPRGPRGRPRGEARARGSRGRARSRCCTPSPPTPRRPRP